MFQEDTEQIQVFDWAAWESFKYPCLRWLYHVPNERKCSAQQGARLKRKGVRAGVPDIFLDVPIGGYHGLRIELKAGKGRPSQSQKEWIENLRENGYRAEICWGAAEAIKVIEDYINGQSRAEPIP